MNISRIYQFMISKRGECMPFMILMAAISILVGIFAIQNSQEASLSFIIFDFESTMAFVTIVAFCCGLLVGACYLMIVKYRHYTKVKKMQEQLDGLTKKQEELEKLVAYLKEHGGEMPPPPQPRKIKNPYIRQ